MRKFERFWSPPQPPLEEGSRCWLVQRLERCLRRLKAPFWLFLLLPLQLTPCGPYDRSFHGYTFVSEEILKLEDREALAPLLNTFENIYTGFFEKKDTLNQNTNIAEWREKVCKLATEKDIAHIVYRAAKADLQLLLTNTRSKSLPVPSRLRGNSFAHFLWESKCDETIEYLIFAKSCEPHVTLPADQWQAPERDVEAMQLLISEGRKKFKRTKSHYIRLRYAYQVIRLAHYAKQYERTLELYDEMVPSVDRASSNYEDSIIPWWIEGHRAGALLRLGRRPEASYLYAQIFQNSPGRRMSAYRSFSIRTDEEWQECLRLCDSDAERAMLYAIRAANPKSRALEEIEAIYRLDPANPQLEVLLVQEVKKVERSLLGLKWNNRRAENKRYHKLPEKGVEDYVISLQAFARQVREERKVERPELWRIAEGYLEFLAGDFYAAEMTYRQAAREVDDEGLEEQLNAFRLALLIAKFETPTPETEELAYEIIQENELYKKFKSFPDYLRDKLTWMYEQRGNRAKAFLCQKSLADLKPNPTSEMVDELLAVALKGNATNFEHLLLAGISDADLLDLKAVMLMSEGQMEAAFEVYKRIPATEWDKYGAFNPFRENFKDKVHLEGQRDSLMLASTLNRGQLIQALLDLEFQAKGDIEQAPRHYYRLGMAYYNMSYFGYEWRSMDFFRSGSTWSNLNRNRRGIFNHPLYPIGNKENIDVSRALFFFEKARLLANTDELKARAAFQAARCEQKLFFASDQYQPEPCCNNIPRLPDEYLVNFSRLKEEYAETEFYERIIQECKYFEAYVARQ